MSKQESYSVLTELPLTRVKPGPTGTTHILTLNVVAGGKSRISDPSIPIRNGDAVIWRMIPPPAAATSVQITFPGMVSVPARVSGVPSDVSVDVSEWVGVGATVVPQSYSVKIATTTLTFDTTPALVIDNMGGM